ncbi:MAG TPA: ATP-binding protein [Candidatus Paceibacterota bacterium]|nr:ATP-binding protein [Candidatus Paceibacterota bacterium]
MEGILNIDLLWVGLAVAGAGTLGFTIYFSDQESATAKAFLLFTSASIFWSIANFASARVSDPTAVLWLIRLVLFCASWHAFSFFLLAYQFPERAARISKRLFFALLSWTAVVSIVVLTPVVYEAVLAVSPSVKTQTGPGIALFGLTVLSYIGAGLYQLTRKFFRSGGAERHQMEAVLTGTALTFVFLIVFDFLFPAFFDIPTLVPYGGLFLLPFIMGVSYAILHYRLFNLRVALFGLLTFLLATATFFDILLSDTAWLVLYRVVELGLVLTAGIWLIKSMVREFELERELQETNARQEGLIHFIGHEVKGFLTKAQGVFSLMSEGELGPVPESMRPFVERGLADTKDGVASVSDILKASNLKKGTVNYEKKPLDLAALVKETVEKEKPTAERKKLALLLDIEGEGYQMTGDGPQIADHVLRNLIENSINYTPTGSIHVSLKKAPGKYVFAVSDTGIGISAEDKARLFTEGGHGKDSQKVNVHSTGYGLFIAKQIVEAHGGSISASSEGPGTGSTFTAEFPAG